MAQFDVRWLKTRRGRKLLVVDLQSDFLSQLETRIVAPIEKSKASNSSVGRLNPTLQVGEERYFLVTQELVSVRENDLSAADGSVREHRDQIIAAIDLLITGI